jgi:membrane-bound lytic murein transglycosylase D
MLKRKLRKTGLVTNLLLFITAAVSLAATRQTFYAGQSVINDTTFQQLNFDTMRLRVTGLPEAGIIDIPVFHLNKQAAEFVSRYIKNTSQKLGEIKEKSPAFFKTMDTVFTKYDLPVELKYLAVVESELNRKALSPVGARGTWQFMPVTARDFSLKVTPGYDERINVYKSTVAVAKYFTYLYGKFGDWLLVVAAFNAGPGKVYEAIKKSGSRNFWKLQNYLPAETRGHVKKFISTHYYFEGKGGATTLTKEETAAYKKIMTVFVEQQNTLLREKQIATIDNINENSGNEEKIVATGVKAELKMNNEN